MVPELAQLGGDAGHHVGQGRWDEDGVIGVAELVLGQHLLLALGEHMGLPLLLGLLGLSVLLFLLLQGLLILLLLLGMRGA